MSMYLDHFGLKEAPFRITPHTDFFFAGAQRGILLEALLYAVVHDEGIVKVTGEVGSGKTMLCRMLLEKLPKNVVTIYLANPSLNRDELLFALADELGMPERPERIHQLLRAIQKHLVELYASGQQIVLLIDEAHAMPAGSLEEIRFLSNLESNRHKLLQIVLFGQIELEEVLARQDMRQLRERITHNFQLEPLHRADVGTYLMFRLRAAGYHGPDLFSPAAIKLFANASQGLSRRLNILADKSLLAAFSNNRHEVSSKEAKAAVSDARFEKMQSRSKASKKTLLLGITTGGGAVLLLAAIVFWQIQRPLPVTPSLPTHQSSTVLSVQNAPPQTSVPTQLPKNTNEATKDNRSLTQKHSQDFELWLSSANPQHYVLQLARTKTEQRNEIETYLQLAHKELPTTHLDKLRVYTANANAQNWIGIVYGEFSGLTEAEKSLRDLPTSLKKNNAFVRKIKQLSNK